jgi:acetylornithine deacetylase
MRPEDLFDALRERVVSVAPAHVDAELLRVTPSMLTPEGTALEHLLRPHASDDRLGAASFATDGGNLEALGMRTLVFGPGSIDVAHQADEFVPVDELHRAVGVVERVVAERCLTA